MGYDDAACEESPTGAHAWELDEVNVSLRGADTASLCVHCGTPRYEPGQAALRDRRPPLGAGDTW